MLILFVGLALDVAKVLLAKHQLQNAADAAALAGARIVRVDQPLARTQAQYIGSQNYTQGDSVVLNLNADADGDNTDPNGDIVVGWYNPGDRSWTPGTNAINALKVVARRTETSHGPIPLVFGPIAHVNTANVSRDAIALAQGGTGAGIIVLACDGTSFDMRGSVDVNVANGGIQVNSTSPDAALIWKGGSAGMTTDVNGLNIVGGYSGTVPDGVDDRIATRMPYMPDPLCPSAECGQAPTGYCIPAITPGADLGGINSGDPCLPFGPGYYSGGINVNGGTVVLKPGIYVLGSGGLNIGGNANLYAQGVMFYITNGGAINMGGTGRILITELKENAPPSYFYNPSFSYPPGTDFTHYEGMAIFQDRNDPQTATFSGTGDLDVTGTIYFPNNIVDLGGTSGNFGTQLIAWKIVDKGGGKTTDININYDGRNVSPVDKSFLVK
jgi:hypothetical protein